MQSCTVRKLDGDYKEKLNEKDAVVDSVEEIAINVLLGLDGVSLEVKLVEYGKSCAQWTPFSSLRKQRSNR